MIKELELPHSYQQLEDTIMAHRYLYYIECSPIIPDYEFDTLERNARSLLSDKLDSPVHSNGSELSDSYSDHIKTLALKWIY
jgi:NAD-dependent DNA ligase